MRKRNFNKDLLPMILERKESSLGTVQDYKIMRKIKCRRDPNLGESKLNHSLNAITR